VTLPAAALLGAALLLSCGGSEPTAPAPAPAPSPAPTPAPAPEPAPGRAVPSGDLRGDAANGKTLYGQFCSVCHGATGKGDGPTAATMFPKPRDHTDRAYMATLSDELLYRTIRDGGNGVGKSPLMPAWGSALNDADIRDVIAHLRALSGT
jgi:mono/diheme cytochrome c family protein